MSIDLIYIKSKGSLDNINWKLGMFYSISDSNIELVQMLKHILEITSATHVLLWDEKIPMIAENLIRELSKSVVDVYHSGLNLGTHDAFELINYIKPTWMLNKNPDPTIEASSWRVSLRAALVRVDLLRELGVPYQNFSGIDAAGIEIGYRWIMGGAIVRNTPNLLPKTFVLSTPFSMSMRDQIFCLRVHFPRKWVYWVLIRLFLKKPTLVFKKFFISSILDGSTKNSCRKVFERGKSAVARVDSETRVSVVIATLDRYDYLVPLLRQLEAQTHCPIEIIVIDQTPKEKMASLAEFGNFNLEIRWHHIDVIGQCTARNIGIEKAKGSHILFLDDDVEIEPSLIEQHLKSMQIWSCNVSNGVANETGMEALPFEFTYLRISDVFPTNNTMIAKRVLLYSGLFDISYDRGEVEDADLGMRLYLAGELMILDPTISLFHHHAPQGGLRANKARVVTYTESKKKIFSRVLPSVSNIYLAKRYFSIRQVREYYILSLISLFIIHGNIFQKTLKSLYSLLSFPFILVKFYLRIKKAESKIADFNGVPKLTSE